MIFISMISHVKAQVVQVCSCVPPVYRWNIKLNYNEFPNPGQGPNCPLNIGGSGIRRSLCAYSTGDIDFNGDFSPANLSQIQIVEFDQTLTPAKVLTITNSIDLSEGSSVSFASTILTQIPGGMQVAFDAINAAGQDFTLNVFVRFTNICEALPFTTNDIFGYLQFVSFIYHILKYQRPPDDLILFPLVHIPRLTQFFTFNFNCYMYHYRRR